MAKTTRSNSRLWIEILGITSAKRWLCQWKFGNFRYSYNGNSNVQEWQGLPKIQNLIFMVWTFSLVSQWFLTFFNPMDCSMPGLPVHHQLLESTKTMSIESVMLSNHLILCRPLLLLLSIFPSIRVFSNELVLCIRWPKYWSFSISPPNEYSGSISFRIEVLLFANYCHRNWASAVNKINGALFSWTSQPSKKTTNKLTKAKDSDCDSCWQGNEQDKMRKEKRR